MTARDPEWIDDVMAIADAAGVTYPPPHPEATAQCQNHPSVRHLFADDSLEQLLADWSRAATQADFDHLLDQPIDLLPVEAVFADVGHCDSRHEHEIRLYTDGVTAYAWSPGGTGDLLIRCDDSTVTVACGVVDQVSDEACTGHVAFALDSPRWTLDADVVEALAKYGERLES